MRTRPIATAALILIAATALAKAAPVNQTDGPRLILVATNFDPKRPTGVCQIPRRVRVSRTALTNLMTTWWDEGRIDPKIVS